MPIEWKKLTFIPLILAFFFVGAALDNTVVDLVMMLFFAGYALVKPKNALIVLFMYFPIRPFLLEYNTALKGIGDIIVFALLFRILWMYRKDLKKLFHFYWFELAFIGFIIVGAVSALITGVTPTAIIFQIRGFVLFYLVFYIAKRLEITKEDVYKFVATTIFVTVIICIHGLIEKLSLRGWLLPQSWQDMPLSSKNRIRIYGMIGNPNILAYYLSFSFAIILYYRNWFKGKYQWLFYVILALTFSVWALTYSRGTWIAVGVALLAYVLVTKSWKFLKTLALTLAAGIVLIAVPVSYATSFIEDSNFGQEKKAKQSVYDDSEGSFRDRIGSTFDKETREQSGQSGRIWIVKQGFEIFLDHPVIGTGFATYGDGATLSYGSPIYDDYGIEREFYSDNQYIQIITGTGIVGVILFAVFLLNMLYEIWKRRKETILAPFLFAVLLAAFAAGMVYNIWEGDSFTIFYFALLGFLLNMRPDHEPDLH
ncbi:O-antigen ligase family protein [Halobacillus sp. ACCC02827]|uniref:O-antigen ligase family protein n=1 Tax=unclassified Halobacillus TaxID=2636472 RepID=UPI0007866563|nr:MULTISPECIES: O-antigen ligase family protein [unclassified Halobacillus]WJE15283.1 O-antigen ligase family protein [Halobacillus sp. ACCC02827]